MDNGCSMKHRLFVWAALCGLSYGAQGSQVHPSLPYYYVRTVEGPEVIGTGGSSTVFKVIGEDQKFYAMKKMKLLTSYRKRRQKEKKDREKELEEFRKKTAELRNACRCKKVKLTDIGPEDLCPIHHTIELKEKEIAEINSELDDIMMMLLEQKSNGVFLTATHNARKEINIQKKLGAHSNILKLQNFKIDAPGSELVGSAYLVMPYGKSLKEELTDGPIPLEKFMRYAKDLICAVQQCHSNGFVHRDLKPDNLVIYEEHLALIDFGLAEEYDHIDDKRKMITGTEGTWCHMGPETPRYSESGGPYDAVANDRWALGRFLYHILSGEPMFSEKYLSRDLPLGTQLKLALRYAQEARDEIRNYRDGSVTVEDIAAKRKRNPTPLLGELVDLINRFLKRDPSDRIEFDDALEKLEIIEINVKTRKAAPKTTIEDIPALEWLV